MQGGNQSFEGPPRLSARDRSVVELIGRFAHLTAGQLGPLLFDGQASKTPLDRTLKRLTERRYLARLVRPVGGDGGGSAQYVYQLGRAGWRLLAKSGEYWPFRAVNLHTLAIAECFVQVSVSAQIGQCALIKFEPEPSCHVEVEGIKLTPDAAVELGYRDRGVKVTAWLEVDRGTEHREVIKEKCVRYWHAYQRWQENVFPLVIFVVPDQQRQQVIEQVIINGPKDAQPLFYVCRALAVAEDIHRLPIVADEIR
jgi:hypothetical protein